MNQMEQGIELTLKVLMKVKDDEIAALCDEINHRDTEAENLKKEIEFLKAENEEVKRQREDFKRQRDVMISCSRVDRKNLKKELEVMKSFYQEEMKAKIERDLLQLSRQHKHSSNASEPWIIYFDKAFNYQNLKVEEHEEIEEMEHELQLKIKKITEHQEAFLAWAKDKDHGVESIKRFEDELQNHNITILKEILTRFGCCAAGSTLNYFLKFLDEDDQPRTYGKHSTGTCYSCYDYPILHLTLYDYEFKSCDYCDADYDGPNTCVYKRDDKPLGL